MKKYFGGEHLKNKRKCKRPLDFKKTTHLVLRLKPLLPSLLNPRDQNLKKGFQKLADKYHIKVYQLVFNHSHLHAAILLPSREDYVKFIKELTSKLVNYFSKTTGIKFKRIFMYRPFTRIVEWGKALRTLHNYFLKNQRESGFKQIECSVETLDKKIKFRIETIQKRINDGKLRQFDRGQLLIFEIN